MKKIIFRVLSLIFFLMAFLIFNSNSINAEEIIIYNNPTLDKELTYGEPLFNASLVGGSANIDGTFSWENKLAVLKAGTSKQNIKFTSKDNPSIYKIFEMDVTINPRTVHYNFSKDIYKKYDGTTTITLPEYTITGFLNKDAYITGTLNAHLESILIGSNVKVILEGVQIEGIDKDNYYLDLYSTTATIYPTYIEKTGENASRIDLSNDVYVPADSVMVVDEIDNISVDNYVGESTYDIYLKSDNKRTKVDGKVTVKLAISEEKIKNKTLLNYYEGNYKKLNYQYENGYLIYECEGLGTLIIARKVYDFFWIYLLVIAICLVTIIMMVLKKFLLREKIEKYHRLKRGRLN